MHFTHTVDVVVTLLLPARVLGAEEKHTCLFFFLPFFFAFASSGAVQICTVPAGGSAWWMNANFVCVCVFVA